MVDTAWPPKSPHAALLSSPSGRQKYQLHRSHRERSLSPTKHPTTFPNLQQASRRLFDDDEDTQEADDLEEDEETLQLKLAAIEAKLKLKKLQQSREKSGLEGIERKRVDASRPQSSTSNHSTARSNHGLGPSGSSTVEVPVSPTRRAAPQVEQRSPGRVLLGIDKGVKGTDVSLRRARSVREHGTPALGRSDNNVGTGRNRPTGPEFIQRSRSTHAAEPPVKSFSERMAESRAQEEREGRKREAIASKRGVGFKLNLAEMESYQKAAAEARAHDPPRSPLKDRNCAAFSRDDVLLAQGGSQRKTGLLNRSSTLPNLQDRGSNSSPATSKTYRTSEYRIKDGRPYDEGRLAISSEGHRKGDPSLFDPYSQLHLSLRVLPHSFLERTFPAETHTCLRLPQLLKQVTAPAYELPGQGEKDIVIVGVIASKSTPLDHKQGQGSTAAANAKSKDDWEKKWEDGSQNQKKFMVLQLSDLAWSVDLYLFGTAVPRYHRLSPGTVVAILNPGIMPPKKGKEDTGAFSLTLHHGEDTLLEIGTARDLGFCVAVRKDGKECGSWVNLTKTEVCEWHLNAQITKTQAGRMGVNTGSNAIGHGVAGSRLRNHLVAGDKGVTGSGRPQLARDPGQKYHRESESHYYIAASSASQKQANCVKEGEYFQRSAASLIDLDDDDPFIAAGRLSRDTETRLKKRLLTEEKEREVAEKLTSMGSGGAGGEYLGHKIAPKLDGADPVNSTNDNTRRKNSALVTKDSIMRAGTNVNGKRAAESVRLSPMKRTRFVTERGIREAGRESLGGQKADHDDDLDIV